MTDTNSHGGSGPVVDPDTYGLLLLELHEGREAHEIMERSDGLIYVGDGADYFAGPDLWPAAERDALTLARGRVLDIGCGAGRVALELQAAGCAVVAIDESPSAVEVSRRRGVLDARTLRWQDVSAELGTFDTIVLARNNLAIYRRSRPHCRRWQTSLPTMVCSSRTASLRPAAATPQMASATECVTAIAPLSGFGI
jgi:SAM-dependent methyltransferase